MPGDATSTLPPEVQEKLARLEKLEKDYQASQSGNAGLAAKLRAWERMKEELGEVIEYDAQGNPVRVRVEDDGSPTTTPLTGHPFSPFAALVDNWQPQAADAYYQAKFAELLNKQGYVTTAQAQQLAHQAVAAAVGTQAVWRMYDRLTAQEAYKPLADAASPLSQRTAKVLQERSLGRPLTHDPVTGQELAGPVPFDRWQYGSLDALPLAADLAAMALEKEAKAAEASKQQAAQAQGAAQLGEGGQGAGTTPTKPDFSAMRTPEEITTALGAALEAGAR